MIPWPMRSIGSSHSRSASTMNLENGKRTVLIITHDVELISNYKNKRIVKFERGKIVYDSKNAEVSADA